MIRNLKVLIAAAMALTAFGVTSATSAHAADEFHCQISPCTLTLQPDGAVGSATAHHVFVVKGETHQGKPGGTVSFTCEQITGDKTLSGNTATEVTFENIAYDGCSVAGNPITVDMTSCDYKFTALNGTPTAAGSQVHLECTVPGDGIDLTFGGIICFKITPLTTISGGIKYHDVNPPNKAELTAEVANIGIPIAAVDIVNTENAVCKGAVNLRKIESATYTTGHTIVTGENASGVMANVWYE
jgi:hypothetical protein